MINYKRKNIIKILILILIICLTIIVPVSYSKYVRTQTGTAQLVRFANLGIDLTDVFAIDQDEIEEKGYAESENLFGCETFDSNGNPIYTYNEKYEFDNLSSQQIPIVNYTDTPLYIKFEIQLCIQKSKTGLESESLTASVKNNNTGDTTSSINVSITNTGIKAYSKQEVIVLFPVNYDYYLWTGIFDPQDAVSSQEVLNRSFIVPPGTGEVFTYTLNIDADAQVLLTTNSNCYASLKIIATPVE